MSLTSLRNHDANREGSDLPELVNETNFQQLLKALEEEHNKEMRKIFTVLTEENEALRKRLRDQAVAMARRPSKNNSPVSRCGSKTSVSSLGVGDLQGLAATTSAPPSPPSAVDTRNLAPPPGSAGVLAVSMNPIIGKGGGSRVVAMLPLPGTPDQPHGELQGGMSGDSIQLVAEPKTEKAEGAESHQAVVPVEDEELDSSWDDGTATYPLRPLWVEATKPKSTGHGCAPTISNRRTASSTRTGNHSKFGQSERLEAATENERPKVQFADGFMKHLISSPGSRPRLAWDLFGGVLILWDLVKIPLGVFSPPDTTFTVFMDWLTLVFWTLNMFASMLCGYTKDGVMIMVPGKILRHYLRFWFWIDLVVVVPDWVFTVLELTSGSKSSNGEAVKMLRVLRLARTIRLIRLLKLGWILTIINDLLDSEAASIIANIVKMIALLLGINHFIACLWFSVGSNTCSGDDDSCWVLKHGFRDVDWSTQYLASFHWSITQFTPASMNVQPQSPVERAFAILVVVFALVGFSYLVGSITGSLTQLRGMKEEAAKEFWKLRRYMKRNRVNHELSTRIQRYLEYEYARQMEGSTPNKVKLLDLLSEQLQNELQCAMAVPHVSVHPLFACLGKESEVTVQRIAKGGLKDHYYARGDPVFMPTEVAKACYFVVAGRLQYTRVDNQEIERKEWVDKGEDWISEPVLWTPNWVHLGVLIATKICNHLLLVDAKKFGDIVSLTPVALELVCNYAKNFMAWLNDQRSEDMSDISQGDEISDMIRGFIYATRPQHHRTCNKKKDGDDCATTAAPEELDPPPKEDALQSTATPTQMQLLASTRSLDKPLQ